MADDTTTDVVKLEKEIKRLKAKNKKLTESLEKAEETIKLYGGMNSKLWRLLEVVTVYMDTVNFSKECGLVIGDTVHEMSGLYGDFCKAGVIDKNIHLSEDFD